MHTDEYEISIARELNVCRTRVAQLRKRLDAYAERFGANSPNDLEHAGTNNTATAAELQQWREDNEALAIWAQRLAEYETALRTMRISAPS